MIASLIAAGASLAANAVNNQRIMRNYYENRHYNTPASQMGRFRAAGLNPHLIYTQTNESDSPPTTNVPDLSALVKIPDELSQYQNIKKSKAEVSNLEKQNEMLSEQIYGQIIENELNKIGLKWSDYEHWINTEQGKQAIKNAKKTYEYIESQIKNLNRQTEFKDFEEFKGYMDMLYKSEELKNAARALGIQEDTLKERIRQFNAEHPFRSLFESITKSFGATDFGSDFGVWLKNIVLQIVNGS